MPIINQTTKNKIAFKVFKADKFLSRFFGLLGTENLDKNKVLHIPSCSSLHTIGMKYPIDLLFLDKHGIIIKKITHLLPNRITKNYFKAKDVLEFAGGQTDAALFEEGQKIQIQTDGSQKINYSAFFSIIHWPVNILLAMLWGFFAIYCYKQFIYSGNPSTLGIFFVNTILFFLFLTRRESKTTTRNILDWSIALFTVILSFNYKHDLTTVQALQTLSTTVQLVGIILLIFSLMSIGRSFGIIPANRIVKQHGAYQFVRHPIYTSEIIFYLGFLSGNWNIQNLTITLLIIAGQLFRAHAEERLLSRDDEYKIYTTRVIYKFIPGIY